MLAPAVLGMLAQLLLKREAKYSEWFLGMLGPYSLVLLSSCITSSCNLSNVTTSVTSPFFRFRLNRMPCVPFGRMTASPNGIPYCGE